MQRDKRLIAPFIFFTVGFVFLVLIPNFFRSDTNLASCYHGVVGSSNSLIQISEQSTSDIKGSLLFQNYEKDSSYGDFVGKYADNKLTASFTYQSEGTESVREIIFKKDGVNLTGDGFNYTPAEDCTSILYNQGLGLIPFDMKLPLHLFPQMKLMPVDVEQLNWAFNPGGFKPIQSAKIVYTPEVGDPVDAVIFFLWQKSVWNVVTNPNEPPDWGVMQWSDQSHVFSVTGPQDCVYPNEPDCGNISELYKYIYEESSYVNKVPKYAPVEVRVVKTKTFHDPETGYYVLSQFNIVGIKADQSYRCDLTAFDKAGKEIISWKTEGLSFSPKPSTVYSGQTNIRPDQVPTVKSSSVKCEVADTII
jgi:hypothetical protein